MDRCFTGAFFPLEIPLCGEPGTETGLEFAAFWPPIVETAWDEGRLPQFAWEFLEPEAVSLDRKRSGGGEGERDDLHQINL